MSGSGLIYAAIALMWAAVLIPMWLRNHDSVSENRSAERFGQAMRVLSRKEHDDAEESTSSRHDFEASDDRSAAVTAPAEQVTEPVTDQAEQQTERPAASSSAPARRRRPEPRRRQHRTLAQRRARTLAVLGAALVVLSLAAVASPVPWWAPLPVAVLVVAFVVHLRVQAIQHERRRTRVGRPVRAERAPAAEGSAEQNRDEQVSAPVAKEQRSASRFVSGPSRAVVVETKGSVSGADVTFETGDEGGDETWRPNPLPLPTYVTAPKAIRPIKVIDLTTPGAWTSGRLLDDDFADEDLLAAEVAGDELDALLEQEVAPPPADQGHDEASRRAVGD